MILQRSLITNVNPSRPRAFQKVVLKWKFVNFLSSSGIGTETVKIEISRTNVDSRVNLGLIY